MVGNTDKARTQDKMADRLTIILGAGSSHDCADVKTATRVNEDWRPPLARDIFSSQFDRILNHYPTITARLDELRTELSKDQSFEEIFRELLESAAQHKKFWPFQVPIFLRELFWTISEGHVQGSTKFDTLVRRVLESDFKEILFVNLNYDLFLEDAIENYDQHQFRNVDSYIPLSKKWRYVKPHGSVNWAKIVTNCPTNGSGLFLPSRLQEAPAFSPELLVVMWNRKSGDFYIPGGGPEGYLYPQIVVPTDRPKDFVCPESHLYAAREFVNHCGHFLVIGFSGRDEHILDFLEGVPGNSCWCIVSKGDTGEIVERLRGRIESLKSGNVKVSVNDMGFSAFVERATFERFLTDG